MGSDRRLQIGDSAILARVDFNSLIGALQHRGYDVIGPTVRNAAVVHAHIDSDCDLPLGWTDEQEAGLYRLKQSDSPALFGYVSASQSWKPFLFQSHRSLWKARGDARDFAFDTPSEDTPRYAFLGIRACDLKGVSIQDKVLKEGDYPDPDYAARREQAFFVAVNCGHAGSTCFCVSMDAGPRATQGFDLALTELVDDNRHDFLLEIGSERGAQVASQLPVIASSTEDCVAADSIVSRTAQSMGRELQTDGLKSLLQDSPEHPVWDDVASRCLSCGNCTFVCPTCFCHTQEDITDLGGQVAERHQRWDSCFSLDFSHIRGGPVRPGVSARYRHWMTHKLANWVDQFGESGCVGCGRCVTWCPAGIDITAEAAVLRADIEEE